MPNELPIRTLIADASVLINFLSIHRLDILTGCSAHVRVTHHVSVEISEFYPSLVALFQSGLEKKHIHLTPPMTDAEAELCSRLVSAGRLGIGECSVIAHAIEHDCAIAMDDRCANTQAKAFRPDLVLFRTPDIIARQYRRGQLTAIAAEEIRAALADRERFSL